MIVSSDAFNRSGISTIIAAVITSNQHLAAAPGNLTLTRKHSGLPRASVVNVSQLLTVDKGSLVERVGRVPSKQLEQVEAGMRLALSL